MPPRFKMAMNNDDNQSTADEETDYLVNNHACNARSGDRSDWPDKAIRSRMEHQFMEMISSNSRAVRRMITKYWALFPENQLSILGTCERFVGLWSSVKDMKYREGTIRRSTAVLRSHIRFSLRSVSPTTSSSCWYWLIVMSYTHSVVSCWKTYLPIWIPSDFEATFGVASKNRIEIRRGRVWENWEGGWRKEQTVLTFGWWFREFRKGADQDDSTRG